MDRVCVVRRVRRAARETNHAARCREIDRSCAARGQRRDTCDHAARGRRARVRELRRRNIQRPNLSRRFRAWPMGDANTLRFGAAGWTLAILLGVWLVVERRARKAAELARAERDRESDADRATRMQRQQDAIRAMRDALSALARETNDERR